MNILEILMNTEFTPFSEFDDYETYAGASEHAMIGEYKDMVIVIDGQNIEVFDKSGECIYSGYVTKDGRRVLEDL